MSSEQDDKILLDEARGFEKKKRADNTAEILGEKRELGKPLAEAEARQQMGSRSRRSFLVGGLAAIGGIFGWRWLSDETKAGSLPKEL